MIPNYYIFIKRFLIFSETKQNKSRHIKVQFLEYGTKRENEDSLSWEDNFKSRETKQLEFTGQNIKVESTQKFLEILTEYTKYETEYWSTHGYKETT